MQQKILAEERHTRVVVQTVAVSEPTAAGPASESESTAETTAASPAETTTETAPATDGNLDEDRDRAFEVALNKRRLEHIPSLPDLKRAQAGLSDYDSDLEVMSCYSAGQGSSDHGSPRHSYRRNTFLFHFILIYLSIKQELKHKAHK